MSMKIGTETGSLVNWVQSAYTGTPVVGEGATEFHWTDRSAYTVTEVAAGGKSCTIVRDKTRRLFEGMTDAQQYEYSPREGKGEKLVFKWGAWRRV